MAASTIGPSTIDARPFRVAFTHLQHRLQPFEPDLRVVQNGVLDVRLERPLVAVRLVPQEAEVRVQVVHAVLDGRAGEAPAVARVQAPGRMGRKGAGVLNGLGLVQNHAAIGRTTWSR